MRPHGITIGLGGFRLSDDEVVEIEADLPARV